LYQNLITPVPSYNPQKIARGPFPGHMDLVP